MYRLWRSFFSLMAFVVAMFCFVASADAQTSYTVQAGDTLSEIAQSTGTTVSHLAEINDLTDEHHIRVGQVLLVPTSPSSAESSTDRYQVVQGDTVSDLARRFGITVGSLTHSNGLIDPDRIHAGQELVVPLYGSLTQQLPARQYRELPQSIVQEAKRAGLAERFEYWADRNGISADLLMAVAYQESGWQQSAVSAKGAIGIGQLMPRTAEWIASDLIGDTSLDASNAEDNIRMSARYLSWLLDRMGSEQEAVAAYYQGPTAVRALGYFQETVQYVASVFALRHDFQWS